MDSPVAGDFWCHEAHDELESAAKELSFISANNWGCAIITIGFFVRRIFMKFSGHDARNNWYICFRLDLEFYCNFVGGLG